MVNVPRILCPAQRIFFLGGDMLDFEAIKRIPIVEAAVGHYRLPLRFRGGYANAICPLPAHKEGDRTKSFSINLAGNYWRCFSDSCYAGSHLTRRMSWNEKTLSTCYQ
jgi:hypothetical protein